MGKLLTPKDKLLFGLALIGDVFEDVRDVGGLVSASYEQMYGFVPKGYKKTNFFNLVSRNVRTGNIEKVRKGNEVFLRLTSEGSKKFSRDFPLMAMAGKIWDGKWRMVVFDVPEKYARARDRLRTKLKDLGFAMLQKSLWISPHDFVSDLREFLTFQGLENMALVLEAKNIAGFEDRDLARRVFRLDELNNKYRELMEEYAAMERGGNRENSIQDIKDKWLRIVLNDPLLPKELLINPWWGEKVRKVFLDISFGHAIA